MRINLFVSSIQEGSFVKVSVEALFDGINKHEERLSALATLATYLNEQCFQPEPIIKPMPGHEKVEIEFQDTRYVFAPSPAHLIHFLVSSSSTLEDLQKILNTSVQIQNIYGAELEGKSHQKDATFGNLAGIVKQSSRAKLNM